MKAHMGLVHRGSHITCMHTLIRGLGLLSACCVWRWWRWHCWVHVTTNRGRGQHAKKGMEEKSMKWDEIKKLVCQHDTKPEILPVTLAQALSQSDTCNHNNDPKAAHQKSEGRWRVRIGMSNLVTVRLQCCVNSKSGSVFSCRSGWYHWGLIVSNN